MATSVRSAVANRLGKSGTLSLKEDVFGVFGNDNPQSRSLLSQMELIETKPFVRVALVTVTDTAGGNVPNPPLQQDLDNANIIYQRECDGAWVYCEGSISRDRPELTNIFDQDDCFGSGHSVSDDEDELFDLGRDLGANIVCYYLFADNNTTAGGCAAHPPGRRGFWLTNPGSPLVAFAHELTHIVGDNPQISKPLNNLMTALPNKPLSSKLTPDQQTRILADPDMEHP